MERVKNPNTNISSIAPLSVHLRNHSVLRDFFQPAKTDNSCVDIFSVYRKESEEFDEDWTKIRNEDFNTPVFVSLLLWSFRDGWNSVAHSTPVSRVSAPCSRGTSLPYCGSRSPLFVALSPLPLRFIQFVAAGCSLYSHRSASPFTVCLPFSGPLFHEGSH